MAIRANKYAYWVGAHVGIGVAWATVSAVENLKAKKRLRANPDLGDSSYLGGPGTDWFESAAYGVVGIMAGGIIGVTTPISYPVIAYCWWATR
jgi:hypothetical protein